MCRAFLVTKHKLLTLNSMIVLNPDLLTHDISIIPRIDVTNNFGLFIVNDYKDEKYSNLNIGNSENYNDGILLMPNIDLSTLAMSEGDRFTIEIIQRDDVILYRGQAIATSQVPQEYKDTKEAYIYE